MIRFGDACLKINTPITMNRFEQLVMHKITPCDPFQFATRKKGPQRMRSALLTHFVSKASYVLLYAVIRL